MSSEDQAYYRARAAQEEEAAAQAASPSAGAVHADLARRYLAKADEHAARSD